jgi:hypothetical protein
MNQWIDLREQIRLKLWEVDTMISSKTSILFMFFLLEFHAL